MLSITLCGWTSHLWSHFNTAYSILWTYHVVQWWRIPLPMQETKEIQVWSLDQEDSLKEEMAICSNSLAWKIPWTEEPGRLQSMESWRVRYSWATEHSTHVHTRKYIQYLKFVIAIWHCVLFGFSDLLTVSCFFSHFPSVHLPLLISSLIFFKHLFYPGDWGWPLSPIYLPLLQAASETPGRQWITDCGSLRWQVSWGRWRVGPRGAQDTGWWSGGDSYHSQPGPRAVFFPLPLLPHRNSSSLLSRYYGTCSLSSTQFKIVTGTPGVRYYQCTLYL